jgi:nucleoside-diphosphate-sugar epimerase
LKIVVTAAVSQIGYWVLKQAADKGLQVIAGYHHRRFSHPVGTERWTAIDLQNLDAAPTSSASFRADVFIHCGPPQFAPGAAKLAAAIGCRVVIAFGSTSALYHDLPAPIGDPQKAAMLRCLEQEFSAACRHHRIAGTLFRPTMVYGAGMDENVCRLARLASRLPVLPLPPNADGLRQPIHAADIAELVLDAAKESLDRDESEQRIFDIGGGERLPYRDMVRRIARAMGRRTLLLTCPGLAETLRVAAVIRPSMAPIVSAVYRMGKDQIANNAIANQAFGFEPRGFAPVYKEMTAPIHSLAC